MPNFDAISGQLIQADQALNLEELCRALHANTTLIIEMVEFNLLIPNGTTPESWSFDSISLRRAQRALSFKRDLELNMPGIALALDLLDQIDDLQNRLAILQRHVEVTPFR